MRRFFSLLCLTTCTAVAFGACGNSNSGKNGFGDDGGTGGDDTGVGNGDDVSLFGDGNTGDSGIFTGDPQTCDQAVASQSYIGCDYWPTVTGNNVWSLFDYAVVVANTGSNVANITVTGPGNTNQTATVAPASLTKIYLPWVAPLKGPDTDSCGTAMPLPGSVLARAAAYHLVASVPVTVYQFNALEYKGQGGAPGKNWGSCPGNNICAQFGQAVGCFSFSNDASLLLPSSAMTGNYRVTGHQGWTSQGTPVLGAYAVITATMDGTTVNMKVSTTGQVLAGGGIAATSAGGTVTLTMNAGDVAELVGPPSDTSDLSGSLVQATHPVQVITGMPCVDVPETVQACDHVEESNMPAETLGKSYVVTVPTAPHGTPVGHEVRIYGNFDGTTLTYVPTKPPSCPASVSAGQVVDCGVVTQDFMVTGDHAFAVGSFMEGGGAVDPTTQPPNQEGDPSESMMVATEQYRGKYVFLAPDDYDTSYADIVAQAGTGMTLDGAAVAATGTPVGSSGYSVYRVKLGPGTGGAHVLSAAQPVGIQVMGYGAYTSYQYPGGLDLQHISQPPPK
ncbi:MAG TPA: IgGFc-binding protein [Polyangiaceae bacterium]|jgi:hypothetical protein